MKRVMGQVRRVVDAVLRNREKLPAFLNRWIDHVADNPDGFSGRLAARSLGPVRAEDVPPPTTAPAAGRTVYIGPTNYAEQGWSWARALDSSPEDVAARNMSVDVPGGFSFRADTVVPVPVYTSSEQWQKRELAAVREYSHVLFEAERPLFGRLFSRDVAEEARVLADGGVSTAFMCHGADIRLPSRHAESMTAWSPFQVDDPYVRKLERDALRNAELLEALGRPVFVSTPDLLADAPAGRWCPVVVDVPRWSARAERTSVVSPLRVVHAPSKSGVKGTPLIADLMARLHERGAVDWRLITGVPSAQMPVVYASADVVLDQFRLGSYGVAACEAMAAGCVVVGHVTAGVRSIVREETGWTLPIVEATPDTLEDVMLRLAEDPGLRADLAAQGAAFVASVHDGTRSARVLLDHWILR